jgi:hypothetical protein
LTINTSAIFLLRSFGYEKKRSFALTAKPLPIISPGILKQLQKLPGQITEKQSCGPTCRQVFVPLFPGS